MRKLMKKKVNMFGKEVSVFLMALVCVGIVSAAVVGYLSNTVTGTFIAAQPMALGIDDNGDSYGIATVDLSTIHGGDSGEFWIESTNNALNEITANLVMTITSNGNIGATCADFNSFTVDINKAGSASSLLDGECSEDGNIVTIVLGNEVYASGVVSTEYEFDFTLELDVEPATYTINTQLVPTI